MLRSLLMMLVLLSSEGLLALLSSRRSMRGHTVHRAASSGEEYGSLKKADLVARCREQGLRVSGTKAALIERLQGAVASDTSEAAPQQFARVEGDGSLADVGSASPEFGSTFSSSASKEQLSEVVIDLLVTEIRDIDDPSKLDPELLTRKSEALMAEGGRVLERVAARRLGAAPGDAKLAGALALIRGFTRTTQRQQARETLQEVLRAASAGPQTLDECLRNLSSQGKLDDILRNFVNDIIKKNKAAASSQEPALLSQVLAIVADRIAAERHVESSDELRTLAAAMRIPDDGDRRRFVDKALSTSLEFAMRFESYIEDAADFLGGKTSTAEDRQRRDAVLAIRNDVRLVRSKMPL